MRKFNSNSLLRCHCGRGREGGREGGGREDEWVNDLNGLAANNNKCVNLSITDT